MDGYPCTTTGIPETPCGHCSSLVLRQSPNYSPRACKYITSSIGRSIWYDRTFAQTVCEVSSAWAGPWFYSGGWCVVPEVGFISTTVPLLCFHSGVWSRWFICLALCESLWSTPKCYPWKWNLVYKMLVYPELRRCSYCLNPWFLSGQSSHVNGQQMPQVQCEVGIAELFWPTSAIPIYSEPPSQRCLCEM